MARLISPLSERNKDNLPALMFRVQQHLAHLQEEWNGEMEPHHLKLKKDASGRWAFDY
ncbi:MAG: hypothetical protein U0871_08550 [Gemmataceae bacterium]